MVKVARGESVCSPRVAEVLLRRLSKLASERKLETGDQGLTVREIQILGMLEMGLSNREIAESALHRVAHRKEPCT